MVTTATDVLWMLDVADAIGAAPIVAGGWGVDALVGASTREHRDLDVLVEHELVDPLTDAFLTASFVVTTDWLPLRIELSDPALGRHIDIHPAYDDGAGGCWQHGFGDDRFVTPADTITEGVIAGRSVRCITVAHQLHLHEGYEPDAHGLADIEILRRLDRRRDGPHGRPHQP